MVGPGSLRVLLPILALLRLPVDILLRHHDRSPLHLQVLSSVRPPLTLPLLARIVRGCGASRLLRTTPLDHYILLLGLRLLIEILALEVLLAQVLFDLIDHLIYGCLCL